MEAPFSSATRKAGTFNDVVSKTRDKPKSEITGMTSLFWKHNRMLAGLMSQWAKPVLCMYSIERKMRVYNLSTSLIEYTISGLDPNNTVPRW